MKRGDKAEFLQLLQRWVAIPSQNKTTSSSLRRFLLWYFSLKEVVEPKYEVFLRYVPQHLTRALELFANGSDPVVCQFRAEYLDLLGEEYVPDLLSVEFGGVRRALLVDALCRELSEMVGEPWFDHELAAMLKAQDYVLWQWAFRFAEKVYRKGLYDRYEESKLRGMGGRFGHTDLRAYELAGRIQFTFARPRRKGQLEHSVSLIGEADRPDTSFGINSCHTDVITALAMIEDVVTRWPTTVPEQRKVFRGNRKIKPDVVAAMEAAHS